MFDGTELSLVYGDLNQEQHNQPLQQQPTKQVVKQAQVPPDVDYNVQEPTYQQQAQPIKEPELSFFDKLGNTKGDVFKLFMFALVILIAISLDRLVFNYLKKYIDENILTSTNEFIIRLSYPIAIVVVIWILKTI